MRRGLDHHENTGRVSRRRVEVGVRGAIGLAVLLVAGAWLITPHPVPLYDGVGLPDEPYRYVHVPAGAKGTAAPTSGTGGSDVANGTNSSVLNVFTGESGPQATLDLPEGGVSAVSGPVTVQITPLAPLQDAPAATIDGNDYQVGVSSPDGPVGWTSVASQGALHLRAPRQGHTEVVLYRPGAGQPWRGLATEQSGNDVWGAVPPGPGQFALAASAPLVYGPSAAGTQTVPQAPGHTKGFPAWAVVLLGVLLALVALIFVIRTRAANTLQGR